MLTVWLVKSDTENMNDKEKPTNPWENAQNDINKKLMEGES